MNPTVIWHELECGGYEQDLELWLELAAEHAPAGDGAILDVGAGTGRVALTLARTGHAVTALDLSPELLAALRERAGDLPVQTIEGDARAFVIPGQRFGLCMAPMQTLQLLGPHGHVPFMIQARDHLAPGGVLAVAIAVSDDFEEFEWHDGDPFPLPDILESEGSVYCSQPTAVRRQPSGYLLERRREIIDGAGSRETAIDRITLDIVTVEGVEEAGQRAGLKPLGVRSIPPTTEHIGSEVILFGV